ncbi:MAG: PPC domain-containing protein, partial [Pyrinomonadaceae bacterium]
MQFPRLLALMGLVFSLVLSLSIPAPAQRSAKGNKSGKLSTSKLPDGKEKIVRQTFGIAPNLTGCPSTFAITPGVTVNGTLTAGDCDLGDGSRFDEWTFTATAGQQISISMNSAQFNTYLLLINSNLDVIAEDNNGGGGTNSRIPAGSGVFTISQAGTYGILANGLSGADLGSYSLTLT